MKKLRASLFFQSVITVISFVVLLYLTFHGEGGSDLSDNRKADFLFDFLLGICTSMLFILIPAWIQYFNRKKELEHELVLFYKKIREQCYERLFLRSNPYHHDPVAVKQIMDILNSNYLAVMSYSPLFLTLKGKAKKTINHILKKKPEPDTGYRDENPYALIKSVYTNFLAYFNILDMYQSAIDANSYTIKMSKKENAESNPRLHHMLTDIFEHAPSYAELWLQTENMDIMKHDLFQKCNAVDQLLERQPFSTRHPENNPDLLAIIWTDTLMIARNTFGEDAMYVPDTPLNPNENNIYNAKHQE